MTFLPSSASIRQTPTTLTNEVGSAPTVSLAKSSLSGSAAAAPRRHAASAAPEIVVMVFLMVMSFLLRQGALPFSDRARIAPKRTEHLAWGQPVARAVLSIAARMPWAIVTERTISKQRL